MLYAYRGRSVLVAVPAVRGLSAGTAFSLYELKNDADLAILPGRCHVDDARNELVGKFLASPHDVLVFVDDDVAFDAATFRRLVDHDPDADIVCGVYPRRTRDTSYPVELIPGGQQADARGLLRIAGGPTGFMRISRRVLETLAAGAPSFKVDGVTCPLIFERTYENGTRYSGDLAFCRKARAAGFDVFCDPELWLEHGTRQGSLAAHLRKKNMLGMGHALARLAPDAGSSFREIEIACRELHEYWCNPWACNAATLVALATLAPRARFILECGSGISTLVMAAANPDAHIWVLEDAGEWAARLRGDCELYGLKNVHVLESERGPHTGYWYDVREVVGRLPNFDLVFVDGPAFHVQGQGVNTDTRRGVYSELASRIDGAIMVVDDANEYRDVIAKYEKHEIIDERVAVCLPNPKKQAA